MGKLEKGIVLAVLFLVAVILGVALNTDSGVAEAASGPLSKPGDRSKDALELAQGSPPLQPAPGKAGDAAEKPKRGTQSRALITEAERGAANTGPVTVSLPVEPEPIAEELPPAPEPERTLAGLVATPIEGLMLYTWRAGDTYASVAEAYLGADRTRTLAKANEGRAESSLQPGDQIYIPVDLEERVSSSIYVVKSGDVLGTISMNVYGTHKKWRQIYDANRDLLPNENSLKVGQKLRIPAE